MMTDPATTKTTTDDNPFLAWTTHPRYADITPATVAAAVDAVLASAETTVQAITAAAKLSWEAIAQPLEEMSEAIGRVWNQVEHMHGVCSSEDWQVAYRDNQAKVVAFWTALGQNAAVYKKLQALAASPAFAREGAARQKIVRDSLRDFRLSGVALPPAQQKTFRQNSARLAELSSRFEENLLAATNAFSLTIADESLLGEMPADLKTIAQRNAAQAGDAGYRFSLHMPSYAAFMQYVTDSALREKMYRAYQTRASDCAAAADANDDQSGGDEALTARDNTPLIAEMVQLRQQQAALLGFGNYATLALQTRMAKTPADVHDFLRDLTRLAKPHAQEELSALQRFAQGTLGIPTLHAWDIAYASDARRREQFAYSDSDLRPYLQTQKIIAGLFACVEKLFGVRMRRSKAPVWEYDVQYLEIVDDAEQVIGGLYLDLYSRTTKRGGAWMADCLSRCTHTATDGGGAQLQKPLAHIVCNFAKPAAGVPALLNWDEAVTLFHECGHALHHLLTEVNEYSLSGISGVEWDAVELPSQLLENFIWEWSVLEPMTAHAETGEPMPKELFAKVAAARHFQSGMWLVRQLEFAQFDWQLHSTTGDDAGADAAATLAAVREATALLPLPDYYRFYCGFAHIFAGGYAAGYYSYLWAEVLAADIFEMFRSHNDGDMSQQENWQTRGMQFRREVLAVGGSRPAMDSFVAMRGRAPNIRPLLAHHNLPTAD